MFPVDARLADGGAQRGAGAWRCREGAVVVMGPVPERDRVGGRRHRAGIRHA